MDIKINNDTIAQLEKMRKSVLNKPYLNKAEADNPETLAVVIDMINGFAVKGALASPRVEGIIGSVAEALNMIPAAKKVYFRDVHDENSIEMKWFPPHCTDGYESAVVDGLKNIPHTDIPKNSTNGIFALLNADIIFEGYQNIIITGCCTDICVLQFGLSLRAYLNENNLPLRVILLTDCVETYDAPGHPAGLCNLFSLANMEAAGIELYKNIR